MDGAENRRVSSAAIRESMAYRSGWKDGRFGMPVLSLESSYMIWSDLERLAYYRGHREGRRVRQMLGAGVQTIQETA
ncbi:hypothetical protein [Rubrobacter naiadicus]|uniref:hypothetical protein n=1 Tax=Rubrobacter naiadicus TaxID=1392641 RepID=UPI00235FC1F6|nr:hypothetical protein [Rubrobacter naiadicus]